MPGGRRLPGRTSAAHSVESPPAGPAGDSSSTSATPPVRLAQPQAGGQDAGGVDDKKVTRADQLGEIGDPAVVDSAGRIDADEEAGGVSRLDRPLGDGLLGQVVVEDVHVQVLPLTAGESKPAG